MDFILYYIMHFVYDIYACCGEYFISKRNQMKSVSNKCTNKKINKNYYLSCIANWVVSFYLKFYRRIYRQNTFFNNHGFSGICTDLLVTPSIVGVSSCCRLNVSSFKNKFESSQSDCYTGSQDKNPIGLFTWSV